MCSCHQPACRDTPRARHVEQDLPLGRPSGYPPDVMPKRLGQLVLAPVGLCKQVKLAQCFDQCCGPLLLTQNEKPARQGVDPACKSGGLCIYHALCQRAAAVCRRRHKASETAVQLIAAVTALLAE